MLEVKHLRKTFDDLVAVNDVSFEIDHGQILGMIGRNGSGKTTIFRMILDFLTPEGQGEVLWNGQPMAQQIYNLVGYLPEERGLYEKLTIEQQIAYFAKLRGMTPSEIDQQIDYWMDKFEVKGKRSDRVSTLSKGNQQKVQLIATLIHQPKVLILDEPFSGLDPVNADLLMQGISELKDKGSCIIFSSHNMNNVEEICDKLVMIHNGEQLLYGTVEEVRESFGRTRIFLETTGWTKESLANLEGVLKVKELRPHHFRLEIDQAETGKQLFETITQHQYIATFSQQPPSLEEIFKMKAGGGHYE
ncbi:ABC transporter ATP-binding protein [Ignavigranum ruoffiae]|uniref:ABC transporter ATP-binding protein n=1 Tax=Ignavigranum ruoffiae TaxID=89093 RepID=UPI00235739FC|nr:ABC transporter ATP-binding protein [Ignavigranum ruoffiae]